ncbi:DUF5819 family protein [Streptomyces sp. NPDC004838]
MNSYEDQDVEDARGGRSGTFPDGATHPRDQGESGLRQGADRVVAPEREPGREREPEPASVAAPTAGAGPEPDLTSEAGPTAGPAPAPAAAGIPDGAPAAPTSGIAALSAPYQAVVAASLGLVALIVCVHLAMVFLHVAPSNTVTKHYGKGVDAWIYPEFEQNWKLFAPNPLQQNIAVQVRAEVQTSDGGTRTTDWIDLSADDHEAIRGNLLPSHVHQNELRRSWDLYTNSHDDKDRATGWRGSLSESHLRRIVMLRLEVHDLGGSVQRIQVRSSTVSVKSPAWANENTDTRPVYRVLPWWPIVDADLPGGVDNDAAERTEGTEAAR